MKPIQNVLIGLNTSDLDPLLIEFASFISRSSPARKFYFINVIKNLKVPNEVKKEFPELVKNAVKERRKHIRSIIGEHLKIHPGSSSKIFVKSGEPYREMLKLVEQYDIDLIIMATHGRSGISRWIRGSVAEKILRASPAPVLLVRAPGTLSDHKV